MISLIQNELMKIFGKKASWVYMIIIIIALVLGAFFYNKFTDDPNPNWRQDVESEITLLQAEMKDAQKVEDKKLKQIQIDEKQKLLDENINPTAKTNWVYMNNVVYGVSSLVTLFIVIICSANVSSEFSDGTIKQLLIRPHRRWKILLSKYISVLIYAGILYVTLVLAGYIVGLLFFGSGEYGMKVMDLGKVAVIGEQFTLKMVYGIPSLLIVMTVAFMLSTLFKSQALAVGIGIFTLFFSSTLAGLIYMFSEKYAWMKVLIFAHMDLSVYAFQDKILGNITLPISLGILLVYYIIFLAITFLFFQKRDVSI